MEKIHGASLQNYEMALNFLDQNITFVWTIEGYYKWRGKLAKEIRKSHSTYPWIDNGVLENNIQDGCVVPNKTPDTYIDLAEKVLIAAGIKSDFATIHIRRGDAKKECSTPLEKIRKYAECSLKNCTKNLPVILFTDETDTTYINGVKQIFQDIDFKFIDGEGLIKSTFRNISRENPDLKKFENNYFFFQTSNFIKSISSYQLVQRRRFACHECDSQCSTRKKRSASFENDYEDVFYFNL